MKLIDIIKANGDQNDFSVPKIYKQKKSQHNMTSAYRKLNKIAIKSKSGYNTKIFPLKYNTNNIQADIAPNINNTIYITAWVNYVNNKLIPRNYGDDINFSFLNQIMQENIQLYKPSYNTKNYLFIGSILINRYVNSNTIVWGSGMLRPKTLTNKPYKICAVRGPKTREILLASGIDCPEVYGDPALLMPYYYYPYIQKKYKLGIIPHHTHIKSQLLNKFKNNNDVKIIDFTSYDGWKSVIKEMLSCDFIVSESLHGLIISEAYRIPNIYVSFGPLGQDFKYNDFFLSINKPSYIPYKITSATTYDSLLKLQNNYNPAFNIDLNALVKSCPIQLKNLNLKNKIKKYTGKVLLCCIGKMENLYIREYVEYYKDLGFDNICLYDNNDPDGEHFEDVINDYIESGFVILKDVRGKFQAQMPSYAECYNEYKDAYDWIAFFDIDEFLHISDNRCVNIKQFLSKDIFNDRGINCVRVCWKQYDDSDIIKTNGDYSVKKFKTYLPITNKLAVQTKPIIKTVIDIKTFSSAHGPTNTKGVVCVNTAGELCDNAITIKNVTWENACLKHYRFKTIEEFVLMKMVRLWPTHHMNGGKTGLNLNMFFQFNKKTKEKEKYAEDLLKKHKINRNEKL